MFSSTKIGTISWSQSTKTKANRHPNTSKQPKFSTKVKAKLLNSSWLVLKTQMALWNRIKNEKICWMSWKMQLISTRISPIIPLLKRTVTKSIIISQVTARSPKQFNKALLITTNMDSSWTTTQAECKANRTSICSLSSKSCSIMT